MTKRMDSEARRNRTASVPRFSKRPSCALHEDERCGNLLQGRFMIRLYSGPAVPLESEQGASLCVCARWWLRL